VFIGLMSNVASWDRGFGPLKNIWHGTAIL